MSWTSSHRRCSLCSAAALVAPYLFVSCLAVAGCSGQPKPVPAPTVAPAPPPVSPPPPPPKAELPKPLVVIDKGGSDQPNSLAEAARRERERRKDAPKARISITDENLAEHATGQVTVVQPAERPPAPETGAATATLRDERYWRDGARERRLRLRRAVDEVAGLEQEVEGQRTRFYAEDDPYIRDTRIKPAWDRAVERLRQAREDVVASRRELDQFLDGGRKAGALPGWLREGIELEPPPEPPPAAPPDPSDEDRHRPSQPKVVGEDRP